MEVRIRARITKTTELPKRYGFKVEYVNDETGVPGVADTAPQSQVNYMITNAEYREGLVVLTFTGVHITGVNVLDGK
jgi:hypothetical protein